MPNATLAEDASSAATLFADREAIRDLANHYAHHVWRKDVPAVVDLFASDAVLDTPALPPITGTKALLDAYGRMFEEDEFYPFVHNHIIEVDGDEAAGTCYIDLRAVIAGKRLTAWGFYEDRYVRRDGTWKFAGRKVNMTRFVPMGQEVTKNPQRTWEETE